MKWYVYAYFTPWNVQPCYVGKGKSGRWLAHEKAGERHSNSFFAELFVTARVIGVKLLPIKIREGLTEDEAIATEMALIRAIGRLDQGTGPLVNLTDGGEGMSGHVPSEATRKKKSKIAMGHPVSAEVREILRGAHLGVAPWNKNKKTGALTSEHREKLKAAKAVLGYKFSEEHRKRLSEANSHRICSDKTKEKMRVAALKRLPELLARNKGNTYGIGNKKTAEGQARCNAAVAEANKKRVHTEESRVRRAQQCRDRWADPAFRAKNLERVFSGRLARSLPQDDVITTGSNHAGLNPQQLEN